MRKLLFCFWSTIFLLSANGQSVNRQTFNNGWRFHLGDIAGAQSSDFNATGWRQLDLPHDWSIELPFDKSSPAGIGGAALNGGVGWYRKTFFTPNSAQGKIMRVSFDGVYHNSEVWINGHSVGKRPNGYVSFEYDLTPWIRFGGNNVIAVKVDNSRQPNSRWYSGSGIYRNVWMTVTDSHYFAFNELQVLTGNDTDPLHATINVDLKVVGPEIPSGELQLHFKVLDQAGNVVARTERHPANYSNGFTYWQSGIQIPNPVYWSTDKPYLYKLVTTLYRDGKVADSYITRFGLRTFHFDVDKGFFLNGENIKIRGVCNHHDLGCLGTAVNRSAIQRQLQLLKEMGCNAIRTSHNPPAPELLDLCDEMGFIVMNEPFDMWKKSKNKFDYSLNWDEWHEKDLHDFIKRDRNHPSVFMWSLGNEIPEQWSEGSDSTGMVILRRLNKITKTLDPTRPTMTANNEVGPWNKLLSSKITDINGYNYNHTKWDSALYAWPGKPFIVTESVSALQTRGHYDFPADSIRIWPVRWDLPVENANDDHTCSAFDNCRTPWGSTHEESLRELENNPHVSGMFVWTGFDYLGEPTPYGWPSRSSYFGIIDLAGFPKDVYYLYQSIWTDKPTLHLFPHWNWKPGASIDVWAYYNEADEVELFLNGVSKGSRRKNGSDMHVSWKLTYEPGTLKAVSRKNGKIVLEKEIHTAGSAANLKAKAFKSTISRKENELAFVTVSVTDKEGVLVPNADNLVSFDVRGGTIAGVDNGYQASLESFQGKQRKAYNGLCLVVVRPDKSSTELVITSRADGLNPVTIKIPVGK